jgi:hypothetical protein
VSTGGHWYTVDGRAMHTVVGKNGSERPTTLRDARQLNLIPSVTTIMRVLEKPQLTDWKVRNAVVAAVLTTRLVGETDEQLVERILTNAEGSVTLAQDFGTALHDLMERRALSPEALSAPFVDKELRPWFPFIEEFYKGIREVVRCESTVVGDGYAGRIDLLARREDDSLALFDFKTSKWKQGKANFYPEHCRQLAAYQRVLQDQFGEPIDCINVGINSLNPEQFQTRKWKGEELESGFNVFSLTLKLWQTINNYRPQQTKPVETAQNT